MVPAMRAALTDSATDDATYVRQVVFLTDGAIGNEQQQPSPRCAAARACSWSASARRRTPS
jgi:hypothetical protein